MALERRPPKKRTHDNDAEKKTISNMRQNVCGVIYNHD